MLMKCVSAFLFVNKMRVDVHIWSCLTDTNWEELFLRKINLSTKYSFTFLVPRRAMKYKQKRGTELGSTLVH